MSSRRECSSRAAGGRLEGGNNSRRECSSRAAGGRLEGGNNSRRECSSSGAAGGLNPGGPEAAASAAVRQLERACHSYGVTRCCCSPLSWVVSELHLAATSRCPRNLQQKQQQQQGIHSSSSGSFNAHCAAASARLAAWTDGVRTCPYRQVRVVVQVVALAPLCRGHWLMSWQQLCILLRRQQQQHCGGSAAAQAASAAAAVAVVCRRSRLMI
jgi:hypothetical protein